MDTIWDRNPSKSVVIGRCGGDETTQMSIQNRQKSKGKINVDVCKSYTRMVLPSITLPTYSYYQTVNDSYISKSLIG